MPTKVVVSITTAVLPIASNAAYMLFSAIDATNKKQQWNNSKSTARMASRLEHHSTFLFKKYWLA